jgi:hypothetical protein
VRQYFKTERLNLSQNGGISMRANRLPLEAQIRRLKVADPQTIF